MNLDKILEDAGRKNQPIIKIYYGGDNCCRCGCKGKYAWPGTKLFNSYLKKIERSTLVGNVYAAATWLNLPVDASTDIGKCFTLYFN